LGDVVLENIVLSTFLQDFYHEFSPNFATEEDEGDLGDLLLCDLQGGFTIKGGQGMVSQDDVGLEFPDSPKKFLLVLHPAGGEGDPSSLQFLFCQFSIEGNIFQHQYPYSIHQTTLYRILRILMLLYLLLFINLCKTFPRT